MKTLRNIIICDKAVNNRWGADFMFKNPQSRHEKKS
jgi:hypothetical protein